ncbi:biopolymer transporter ExbD [Hwanghaeella grinnelliae]|uniref:Biopolymer transporter ExbD n=1 Tax=Hwanghaeella grinnelliae TaxID=2500179 RepID=A0A437QGG4_9PROT|nr:biopolymer transporter ExbD [Hwanghaeella grinnelliae]RVU33647.1 biopolymer transporter ExbD [Hwanghaeella grinnelliae]
MLANPQPKRRSLISLTPLIDVVFILLVFFMLASNFLDWRSINLNAPAESTGRGSSIEGSILVEIRADGLRMSGLPISLKELSENISEQLKTSPDRNIFVEPAPTVTLQETVAILDVLTDAGASNISLINPPGH